MNFAKLLFISLTIFLAGCGSSSSSSGGSDKNALRCVDLSESGNTVTVANTCTRDINARFFGNNTGWFFVAAKSEVSINKSRTTIQYGACFAPYKPRTEGSGEFSCQK